ncbi:PDR/VanB family oxidoreductase [Streptomyces sp. NPDC127039]|uniref:PDR/VanB family oxidoreductase n=1 Tax=Streptomyces sp. NPDC127039 TaxID=3347115 RepID=UPI003660BC65
MITATPVTAETALGLRVVRKEVVAEGVVRLTLAHPDGEPLPVSAPGAHIDLVVGEGVVRQYSLCGAPEDRSVFQVAVLREPAGRGGSRYVHDTLAEGDLVQVRGPRNHFALVDAPRYLFVAGGIGVTPMLPMIAEADRRGADWRLVHGGRSRSTMAFSTQLAHSHPDRVDLVPQDEAGLIDLTALLGSPRPDTAVYCCGPEPLLSAVERLCDAWPRGALHVERFVPKPHDGQATASAFDVELARSGKTLTVPADRSLLDAIEEAGVPVLSSCREGTCGTCETGVLDGRPDHRDSLLTEEERAAGDVMFPCVSRSHSRRLVLDL